ncbi:MAG TPA: exodeoxyribonuclease VII large subunit [Candidatus Pacearchaeota archaeon]|nr:exodeoxyribonuclease VII large subunit [Candidatus Pacearchaeota archaeon]
MYKEILKNNIFTVSEYIEFINNILLSCEAKIEGEVDQVKKSSKGHVYFSLKDKNGSILDCVIWNYYYRICSINLEEGMHVVITGAPSVYAPTGRMSFKASLIELVGEGALKKQYEELKKKLEKEGLFNRQLELKKYPKVIGVITSKHGAVIHDFLNNLGKYNFKIEFIDSRVEGVEAIEDLIFSIKTFKKRIIDCLVVMRGGGSKNSFDVFNNETVIREIIDFPCPIISGLGHHEDEPLFALASDYSVSTPTAAAHLLNSSWNELIYELKKHEQYVFEKYNNLLNTINFKIESSSKNLLILENEIKNKKVFIDNLKINLINNFYLKLKETKEKVNYIEKQIAYCDPKKQLKLGYSILRKDNKIIKSIEQIEKGDLIDLEVLDGIIKSKIYDKKRK